MSQIIMNKRVLLAALLVVALIVVIVEAQRYGGGYGGGYGRGGGRGYYGGNRGGYYGGGRGNYGGGRGYYGGGGRGYGGGRNRGYEDFYSVYPSSGGGGYSSFGSAGSDLYDELDDGDDYYGLDVYATSSSNPSLATSIVGSTSAPADAGTSAASSSDRATFAPGGVLEVRARPRPRPFGWNSDQPQQRQPSNSGQDGRHLWQMAGGAQSQPNDGNSQGPSDGWSLSAFAGNPFDLATGGTSTGDQSSSAGTVDSATATASDRASERHVLLSSGNSRRQAPASSSSSGQLSSVGEGAPRVPTSTTTPAPEFVMINPTTNSSA